MGNLVFQATLGGQVNLVGPNTASTFNLNVPAVSSTIATTSGTETLTNKTLTSPVISGGTIDNAVIGGTTAAAGSFTTLSASSTLSVTGAGTIQGLTVGKGAGAISTNTAVGVSALAANVNGYGNAAFGYNALLSTTDGYSNTGIGRESLRSNTTGASNVGVGREALYSNTTASNNTAVGYQAGYSNTTGTRNVFLGHLAGYTSTADYNTFVGSQAGQLTSTGTLNTFIGVGSGSQISTGSKNSILGAYAGNTSALDIRTASNYIVLSDGDGNPNCYYYGGEFNINSNTGVAFSQVSFRIAGSLKSAFFWDGGTSRLYSYTNTTGPYVANGGTSWTNSSDARLKNITGEIQNGLSKVCSLRAAEYTWKADEEAKPQVGLIAQDVLAVLPEAVDVPPEGSTDKEGNEAMMGVQYNAVIPLLVAAIKELKAEIDTLKGQA